MDIWDITKLVFRRWYVAVPMLLVSVVAVVVASHTVKPDYSATGHILIIPPAGVVTAPGDTTAKPRPHNPWEDLGALSLGQAAIIRVQDKKVLDGLADAGFTSTVTMTIDLRTPLIEIEAVGRTPQQAIGTVQQVMKMLDSEITSSQKQYGVTTPDMFTTLQLDHGDTVTAVTSKRKRVLVVTAGLGVLLTTAGTIMVDALVRRRRRRTGTTAMGVDTAADKPAGKPDGAEPAPDGETGRAPSDSEATQVISSQKVTKSRLPSQLSQAGRSAGETNGKANVQRPLTVRYQYRKAEEQAAVDVKPPPVSEPPVVAPDDTVILPPLGEGPWAGDRKRS